MSRITPPSRREFLLTLGAASGALLTACGSETGARGGAEAGVPPTPWVKDPGPFIRHPTNLETRLELLEGLLTPNELFFVRNHAPTPRLDAADFRLRVEGDGAANPIELSYEDILRLPSRTLIAYLECAGNWRSFFDRVLGTPARGGQWGTGAVGCAEWTGTSLANVLHLAGLRDSAMDVNLFGVDAGEFNRPMPVDKALDPNTLLVYAMNGAVLPPDHGYPIRAVVPGWAGSNSVKWLGRIAVSTERQWVRNNTTSYVLIGPRWPKEQHDPADGAVITTLAVKSALALPWPARLATGRQLLRGFAYSPHGRITRVEWKADEATRWSRAQILEPVLPHAWVRFEFPWTATPGSHTVRVRATDERGNTQPDSVPFNEKGYLLNIPLPHPVEVA
ncbi:MAG: molybdopterin-dependent oxidoreductase [Gemmatimonadales bacterium]|nr:molybdopterin-dependent oxidoreductase [Gemmatimonadales bacterium]NIN10494.1 molybdopterin-dependent oxidoreductase [Gemmatimonadales bacterium]NIN49281.1 molybdopterin-dependent oxidoreductase [Gemmatimonadales bacterium]NIP06745.1 molybdopterin-dependent oxidoreductase [Gemmatimonadales bacterium]NIR02771.1 molybdopterin-dependent oxidoreductase [Gemmatimonadales bacterium]